MQPAACPLYQFKFSPDNTIRNPFELLEYISWGVRHTFLRGETFLLILTISKLYKKPQTLGIPLPAPTKGTLPESWTPCVVNRVYLRWIDLTHTPIPLVTAWKLTTGVLQYTWFIILWLQSGRLISGIKLLWFLSSITLIQDKFLGTFQRSYF